MEVVKFKNYKAFAEELKTKTGCDNVNIKLMSGNNHYHFQLDKMGVPIGIVCYDNGNISFAPFVSHETAHNEQYISMNKFPMLEELIGTMVVLRDMFME